ncbi:MAG: O-antigen polymerase [Candidatus Marinimicrobia bacterium]|nr:O-antigen polymerase [Candidatus Neomarinimicrobiota bacterium]
MKIRKSFEKSNRRMLNVFIIVLLINTVIDTIIMMYSDRSLIISLQYIVNIGFLLYFFLSKRKYAKCSINRILAIIIVYFVFLGLFSSNYVMTYNYLAKFSIPFLFFIVGYSIIKSPEEFKDFTKKSLIILIYFVGYIIYANVFSVGTSYYGGVLSSFKTGYIGLQGLYIPTFLIIQALFILPFYKKKLFVILLSSLGIIIFVLILKRTNIILLILGFVMWLYYEKKINKKYGIIFLIILGTLFYVVFSSELFIERVTARSSRFSSEYSITEEGRYKENLFIWNQVNDSPISLLFGSGEVFNDKETMTREADFVSSSGRQTHNSYARLLWSGGLLGVYLFLLLYYRFWKRIKNYYTIGKIIPIYETLYHLALTLIIIRLINDLSSGITYLTFNAYFYFTIGTLMRVGYNKFRQKSIAYEN